MNSSERWLPCAQGLTAILVCNLSCSRCVLITASHPVSLKSLISVPKLCTNFQTQDFRHIYLPQLCIYFLCVRATCSTHITCRDFITVMIFGWAYKLWKFLCSVLHSLVPFPLIHPNVPFSTLLSSTLAPYSSHREKYELSHTKQRLDLRFCVTFLILQKKKNAYEITLLSLLPPPPPDVASQRLSKHVPAVFSM
jgi:hypothetical protein